MSAGASNANDWPAEIGNPLGIETVTDEFSFLLRPGPSGIGVFAAHAIRRGTALRLYDEQDGAPVARRVRTAEVPGEFLKYCVPCAEPGWVSRPTDFGRMDLVWFLNHSATPNAAHDGEYRYVACRDIGAGEEILIDYNVL